MKATTWSHAELYGVESWQFQSMIPMLQMRKELAGQQLCKLVAMDTSSMDAEAYSLHQRHIMAVSKAIDFNNELISMIKDGE